MKRMVSILCLTAVFCATVASASPTSPQEMAAELERWLASGGGALLPPGSQGEIQEGDSLIFVDASWPAVFQSHIGETVAVRISPVTGFYEFIDSAGAVFWREIPVHPLTWNWLSPFLSPFVPDTQGIYSPARVGRKWTLTTEALEASRISLQAMPRLLSASSAPVTNLCFTGFSITNGVLYFTADWPEEDALPGNRLDLYGSTNGWSRFPFLLASQAATNPPVTISLSQTAVPNFGWADAPIHDAACTQVTNLVLSPLDGVSVYTNVVWNCAHSPLREYAYFRLGTRQDSDGDGMPDAFEENVLLTNPLSSDSNDDGVPDGADPATWAAHPLWAANAGETNVVVCLLEPITNGTATIWFDDLAIPLSNRPGPWYLGIPEGGDITCRLICNPGVTANLWIGPPEAISEPSATTATVMRSTRTVAASRQSSTWSVPTVSWSFPTDLNTPIWSDGLVNLVGNSSGGECRLVRPEFSVSCDEPSASQVDFFCVHNSSGIVNFQWDVSPTNLSGLVCSLSEGFYPGTTAGTGYIDITGEPAGGNPDFYATLSIASETSPPFQTPSLWGRFFVEISAHKCLKWRQGTFCLACGSFHTEEPGDSCFHAEFCLAKTNPDADCTCPEVFMRPGETAFFRLVGEDLYCCFEHSAHEKGAQLLSASPELNASVDTNLLTVAPTTRSPTLGGYTASWRHYNNDGSTYRDLTLPFTVADVSIEPILESTDKTADEFMADGTLYYARSASRYPIRLRNSCPGDARLVLQMNAPDDGAFLCGYSDGSVPLYGSEAATNALPFAGLVMDKTVYLDASCTNSSATISATLYDTRNGNALLTETLPIRIIDTSLQHLTRYRSPTDSISYDFSDAPVPVQMKVVKFLEDLSSSPTVVTNQESFTPSFSLDLSPGNYGIEVCFPWVYSGTDYVTPTAASLQILENPTVLSVDGCLNYNRAAHHTEYYETNALVIRRAQSFQVKTTVSETYRPELCELKFFVWDDFSGTAITNIIEQKDGTVPTTEWFYGSPSTSENTDGTFTITADIYCATTNCPIGNYRFGASLFDRETGEHFDSKEMPEDLFVFFNPWSSQDSVYFNDPAWREECVLNTNGIIWTGTYSAKYARNWNYEQFSDVTLITICRILKNLQRTKRMSPVGVSRHLSWMANARLNEDGILVAKWGTNYVGGVKPGVWKNSRQIFSQYLASEQPVKYGQCWVFSGIVTSLARACGIPSRPVTNYLSGQDVDGDGEIIKYYNIWGVVSPINKDKIWNFHVWTEVWMTRPDIQGGDGWQIVDGTPQKRSEGLFQCGPASRTRVKARTGGNYDTDLIQSEVSAPVRYRTNILGINFPRVKKIKEIGVDISTKDRKSTDRLDLTNKYKKED